MRNSPNLPAAVIKTAYTLHGVLLHGLLRVLELRGAGGLVQLGVQIQIVLPVPRMLSASLRISPPVSANTRWGFGGSQTRRARGRVCVRPRRRRRPHSIR